MRTTLSLDEDVAQKAQALRRERGCAFKQVINEALRAGLAAIERPPRQRPYRTRAHRMGLREGLSLDNVQELLAQVEGEGAR